jgi:hypothetical protein
LVLATHPGMALGEVAHSEDEGKELKNEKVKE